MDPATIDIETPLTTDDRNLLERYGWEISADGNEARLYSEEWTTVQVCVWSTKCWIEENA